ncbi:Ribonuclease H-like protein [Purpureocillium lavendulum]|uniref:Ribonuclease H-like protein n=1 Tax=Purpureocillium lavendulum TaxID=1247861 RepID=A0AB34FCN2_9HYPO|nr:Ribonuclease H-like protein [Purpureocillium lavendulum]
MSTSYYERLLSSPGDGHERTEDISEADSATLIEEDTADGTSDGSSSSEGGGRIDDDTNLLPSLYPCYIPFDAQHLVLTTAQEILEECCFDFAKQWLPSLVHEQRWSCAAAVELNRWTQYLDERTLSNLNLDAGIERSALEVLLMEIRNLRDVAVYRVPTTARGVSQLLHYAKQFSTLLKDGERTAAINRIKEIVDDKIYLLELNKKVLESTASGKLRAIREQHAALIRQEEQIVEDMMHLDIERGQLAGRVLRNSIEKLMKDASRA